VRALSPLAAMVLIIIVSIASTAVLYTWVSGEFPTIALSGITYVPIIRIESVEGYKGHVVVFVRNLGDFRAVVDMLYLEKPGKGIVAVGKPVGPNVVEPRSLAAIAFDVGIVPDGKYIVKVSAHGSSASIATSEPTYLKLTSGIPALVFNEIKVRGTTDKNSIEIYNPTPASINVSLYTAYVINHNWAPPNHEVKVKLISTTQCLVYQDGTSNIYPTRNILPTTIIPPRGYLYYTIGTTRDLFDIINIQPMILNQRGEVIDDGGTWSPVDRANPQKESMQRVFITPPKWIVASPTFGKPNAETGKEALT